ncbi:MAG: hypothetical protein ACRD3V_11900 [Vicinamibacteria bacterium]
MTRPTIIATSIGRTRPHSITFEVSDIYLADAVEEEGWSEPVRFRFEQRDDGQWDLVFRVLTEEED